MEFIHTTLGEISLGGKGSYGIAASAVEKSSELYTYLRITDIKDDGTLNLDGLMSVNDPKAEQYLLSPNDIVFARTGASTGRNYFHDGKEGEFVYAGFLIRFSIDPQKVNPKFVKYYCLSKTYRNWVHSYNAGSTRGNINAQTFAQMPISLPPRKYQDRAVSILDDITEKIKNNELINKNLEQQMQTYFDELFVVNANPSWPNISLSEIGTIVAGGTPSKAESTYYTDNGIAWITPKDLSVNKSKFISHGEIDITNLGFSKSSATKMPAGTVLFSSRAPIGYIAIAQNELTTNQGFKSIVPNKQVGTAYVYFLLKHLLPTIEGMASGSTFKEISGAGMKSVPTFMPDDTTMKIFSDFCTPIFKQQENLEAEISSLTAIRDALIPKLMSGELDISQMDI